MCNDDKGSVDKYNEESDIDYEDALTADNHDDNDFNDAAGVEDDDNDNDYEDSDDDNHNDENADNISKLGRRQLAAGQSLDQDAPFYWYRCLPCGLI